MPALTGNTDFETYQDYGTRHKAPEHARTKEDGGYGGGEARLTFEPEAEIDAAARAAWLASAAAGTTDPCGEGAVSRRAFAAALLAQGRI